MPTAVELSQGTPPLRLGEGAGGVGFLSHGFGLPSRITHTPEYSGGIASVSAS